MSASKAQTEAFVDLAIVLALHSWPALTLAVQNSWGGPDGSGKRDWLAGVISERFQEEPETDEADVEDILLQVMADEFDVNLEDGSEEAVAKDIVRLRGLCLEGDFEEVKSLQSKWEERQRKGGDAAGRNLQVIEHKGEDESSSGDESGEDEDDVEMGDTPQTSETVAQKEKPAPEIDEDGFTKVVSKKKR